MKQLTVPAIVMVFVMLLLMSECVIGGRGGRGGGRGGGARPVSGSRVVPGSAGSFSGSRSSAPIVGPGGGSGQASRGSGSYTTKGGSTIDYKGATVGGSTAGGAQGARHVGGVQVTTPGGREATRVGQSGIAQGPGGTVVGGKSGRTAVGTGPGGSIGTRYQGGAVLGPQGGAVVGGSRGGVAAGGYGAAGGRTSAIAGHGGTYYRSTAIRGQGVYVRQGVANYNCFRPGWYAQHPRASYAAGWAAGSVWRATSWATCSSYCGFPTYDPIYYDYGDTVFYLDNTVYISGETLAARSSIISRPGAFADTGRGAKVTKDEEWLPLGVFAMVQGDEKTSNHIFQLAVNKQGMIRGNYYDAVTDSTSEIFGSVDQKSQRAAWTVGDRKTPVYEAGIANLTKNETTMLVHYAKDRTAEQFILIRIEEPEKKQ